MRECDVCGEENPASLTECRWCGTDLTAPDPIQEADITDPPTTQRKDPAMGLFTHKSNEEAAYRTGADRAERAIREDNVPEHEQMLTELNAHPQTLRGFRDRIANR